MGWFRIGFVRRAAVFDCHFLTRHLSFRIEPLLSHGGGFRIDGSGNTNYGISRSENLREHGLDLGRKIFLGLLLVFHDACRIAELGIGFQVFGKDIAGVVDHGDIIDFQPLHRAGNQRADGINGRLIELGASRIHKHGCRGAGIGGAHEETALGEHNHHARGFDALHLRHRAAQFTLEGAGVVCALNKVADAEIAAIEDFKSNAVRCRQAFRCQIHPDAVDILRIHEDRAASSTDLERDALGFELFDNFGGFFFAEFAVEELHIRPLGPVEHGSDAQSHRHACGGNDDAMGRAQFAPNFGDLLECLFHPIETTRSFLSFTGLRLERA